MMVPERVYKLPDVSTRPGDYPYGSCDSDLWQILDVYLLCRTISETHVLSVMTSRALSPDGPVSQSTVVLPIRADGSGLPFSLRVYIAF
jgi:hypothetical protein